jgi:radical SAM protein with 4Fe4S-binding SPASM domain
VRKIAAYLRIFYHWRLRRSTVLDYLPEDLSIELTNTCNFKCAFCPQSDPEHFQRVARTALSPAQASTLLQKIRAGGVRTNVIHWTLDGEPFVNSEIGPICDAALEHGFNVFIFATNGYFLSRERLASLPTRRGAQYTLCVDFCADQEYFETYRGTKTSWARVRDNIRHALEDDSLKHVRFRVTDISSFTVRDRLQLQERMTALSGLFPPGRISFDARVFHNMAGFLPGMVEEKKRRSGYHVCPYPWASLVIASNGDVVACCRDLEHRSILGNLFTEDLGSVWNGERYRRLRENLVQAKPEANPACRNCDMPWDGDKLSLRHILDRAVHRLGVLK